ncbi:hypothetical protein BS17DRAFT_786340 [Gyrodon lividus]|nr:hypothetical protein BS17DRAFT_786340 [Gyrodon lividus]
MESSLSELGELGFPLPSRQGGELLQGLEVIHSDDLVDGEWTKLYNHHWHHHQTTSNHSHSTSRDVTSRRSSPMPTSLRFSQQSTTQSHIHVQRDPVHKSILDSWLSRRSSVQSASTVSHATNLNGSARSHGHSLNSKLKGKERSLDSSDSSSVGFGYGPGYSYDADNFVSTSSNPSASVTSYESSPCSAPSPFQSQNNHITPTQPRRPRTSLLSAASDALGLRKKIGSVSRKKVSPHHIPHTNHIMPEVIEISAHNNNTITSTIGGTTAHRDYEYEERERLRGVAAQSIGLDPELLHHSHRPESLSSLDSPQGPHQPVRIPPFPATLAALAPLTDMSATLPKFTPPSSLLVYALAKQWKPRTIVLTSHTTSQKAHVHLFKGAAPDEREVERLQVTEHSVIFVAEEEVGGRGNVVKFAGKDVGAKRSGSIAEDLRTMWFLQITDPAESQRWITAIKNAVLGQRSLRAGLGIPAQMNGGHEPRGDMDVMLSMRLQGIISTQPTKSPNSTATPRIVTPKPSSPSPSPSIRSLTINIPSSSPAAAIKGIFTGTRSRSPSLEGSHSPNHPQGLAEDSFGAMGTSLLTMLRTNATLDVSSSPSSSLPLPLPHAPAQGSPASSVRSASAPIVITASDLKISKERDIPGLSSSPPASDSTSTPPGSNTPLTPFYSPPGALTQSLQPPPRKSKHGCTLSPFAPSQEHGIYKQENGNRSVAGSFGIQSSPGSGDPTPRITSPASLRSVSPSVASVSVSPRVGIKLPSPTGGRPRTGLTAVGARPTPLSVDVRSTSLGSGLYYVSPDMSINGATNMPLAVPASDTPSRSTSIIKRWSRQGGPLPKRLTPPSGPPPSIPRSPGSSSRASVAHTPHPYAADRPPSSASSNSHSQAGISPGSGGSLSPTFWKRTSDSSAYSMSSESTSDSRALGQISALVDGSVSSPLGSVVRVVGPSQPMPQSVPAPSPVAGSTKRRSMPPPRPAPSFAPPPAPSEHGTTSGSASPSVSAPSLQKSFRNSVAQRALRLSLTAPKPPPSSVLPPRPDEGAHGQGHRRSTSSGNTAVASTSGLDPIPASPTSILPRTPSLSRPAPPTSSASSIRSLSIKQRLRILSAPSASSSPVLSSSTVAPSAQVSTLHLSNNIENDPPTRSHGHVQSSPPYGLGEHITTMQNDPSFLEPPSPVTPTIPKPPPRSPFRPPPPSSGTISGMNTLTLERDCDFVALSPPPPRRGSKHMTVVVVQPDKLESELPEFSDTVSVYPEENMLTALSQRGSVVSLGFITTS